MAKKQNRKGGGEATNEKPWTIPFKAEWKIGTSIALAALAATMATLNHFVSVFFWTLSLVIVVDLLHSWPLPGRIGSLKWFLLVPLVWIYIPLWELGSKTAVSAQGRGGAGGIIRLADSSEADHVYGGHGGNGGTGGDGGAGGGIELRGSARVRSAVGGNGGDAGRSDGKGGAGAAISTTTLHIPNKCLPDGIRAYDHGKGGNGAGSLIPGGAGGGGGSGACGGFVVDVTSGMYIKTIIGDGGKSGQDGGDTTIEIWEPTKSTAAPTQRHLVSGGHAGKNGKAIRGVLTPGEPGTPGFVMIEAIYGSTSAARPTRP